MRRYRFVLHLDVMTYFPSIDRGILLALVERRIRDRQFLAVVGRVLEAGAGIYELPETRERAGWPPGWPPPGRGIAIGSSVSQLFAAQVYLAELDHFLKRRLKVPGALRYLDDLFCFGDRRAELRRWRGEIASWLEAERGLRLKHPAAPVLPCRGDLDGLGYRVTRAGFHVRRRALAHLRWRLASAVGGDPAVEIERSIASSVGVALF
jgi:hypothetical protein